MKEKTACVLIGGAIKGLYGHIAFLKVLEEHGIKPSIILGASAGSIIGSFYASGKTIEQMYHEALIFGKKDYIDFIRWYTLLYRVINSGKGLKGLLLGKRMERYMERQLAEQNEFSLLPLPLYVGVINLNTKKVELVNSGKVSEWVRASASIPVVYEPKKIGDYYYIDGAIAADNLPYLLLEKEPDISRVFICNFTGELRKQSSAFMDSRDWPLLEIVHRTIDSVLYSVDNQVINNVPVYTITPDIPITLDFIDPPRDKREIAYMQGVESCRIKFNELDIK